MKMKYLVLMAGVAIFTGNAWAESCGIGCTYTLMDGVVTIIGDGNGQIQERFDIPSAKKVIIGDGITSVGGWAFFDNKNITSLEVRGSNVHFNDRAFEYITNATDVVFSGSNITTDGYALMHVGSGSANVEISGSDIHFNDRAFEYGNLSNLSISGSDITMSGYAFQNVGNISNLSISGSDITMSGYAFQNVGNLSNIDISGTNVNIGNNYAFEYAPNLKSITFSPDSFIPNRVWLAFQDAENLTFYCNGEISACNETLSKMGLGRYSSHTMEEKGKIEMEKHRASASSYTPSEAALALTDGSNNQLTIYFK